MVPVTIAFRLPPVMLLSAPVGCWPRAPRGCRLDVGRDGAVLVTSYDGHESYAIKQVMRVAAAFLRAVHHYHYGPRAIAARLAAGGRPPVGYAISLGAKVSIARTSEAPALFGDDEPAAPAKVPALAQA